MKNLLATAAVLATVSTAWAEPAVIYGDAGKFDQSFNEAAYNGVVRYMEETGETVREFEPQSEEQFEQALRRFARDGASPIALIGFAFESAVETVAAEFPDTQFAIIDSVVDLPNVRSVVFSEHEGSYLVGVLAGMASVSGTVGFVGGMDIPLISKFACGYVQGVRSVNADAIIIQNMTGTTGAAWTDPVRGGELATGQIADGADVIYHAAGPTGRGVLQAAADAGILGIGVDSNQNWMQPGSVLTSMLKRVDVGVFNAFNDARNDSFTGGTVVMGVAEDGVGYSLDEHNAPLITAEMQTAVDAARAGIISGEITVHDYLTDGSCPIK
jgi:basic membrane protein A|tara:strand:+ start:2136 stop:3119 length:984 start_codon:yes stop_codon:yes gene_type:complete